MSGLALFSMMAPTHAVFPTTVRHVTLASKRAFRDFASACNRPDTLPSAWLAAMNVRMNGSPAVHRIGEPPADCTTRDSAAERLPGASVDGSTVMLRSPHATTSRAE